MLDRLSWPMIRRLGICVFKGLFKIFGHTKRYVCTPRFLDGGAIAITSPILPPLLARDFANSNKRSGIGVMAA